MYGKNLCFKTGGVDGCDCEEVLSLIKEGKIDTTPQLHAVPPGPGARKNRPRTNRRGRRQRPRKEDPWLI